MHTEWPPGMVHLSLFGLLVTPLSLLRDLESSNPQGLTLRHMLADMRGAVVG